MAENSGVITALHSQRSEENAERTHSPSPVLILEEEATRDDDDDEEDSDVVNLIGAQHMRDGSQSVKSYGGDAFHDESYSYRHMRFFSQDTKDSIYANNFYITMPWSPQVYFTVRGAENFHIYLWIAKDLCWTQSWYYPAYIFGSAALGWCLILLYHAVSARCITEVYMLIPMMMWLSANFIWMSGKYN